MTDHVGSFCGFFSVLKLVLDCVVFRVRNLVPVFVFGSEEGVSGSQASSHVFEVLRSSPTVGVPCGSEFIEGRVSLNETRTTELLMVEGCTELNPSQYVRLSRKFRESRSDLPSTQVKLLRDLCLVANRTEEFFLSVSKDLWLRTDLCLRTDSRIDSSELMSSSLTEAQCCALFQSNSTTEARLRHFSSIFTIHSIVVPRRPYWKNLRVVRDDQSASKYYPCTFLQAPLQGENSVIEYFPSTFLEAPLQGNTLSLKDLFPEWMNRQMLNRIDGVDMSNMDSANPEERPFWKLGPADLDVNVASQKLLGEGSEAKVWNLSWRGGTFVRKEFSVKETFIRELEAVRRVKSHPHIVYSFGVYEGFCLLMEKLDRDLICLIAEKVLLSPSEPPFSRQDSVDMLLQIAKAMTHMHEQDVVHGDLKPDNILVSHCEIVGDVWHHIVKVADFGSATIIEPFQCTFEPAGGTTRYAAPEVLQRRKYAFGSSEKAMPVAIAKKGDVHSFAITAFQVLTGNTEIKIKDVKAGIKPRLREECSQENFWYDEKLIELIEECWAPEPEHRPSFSEVTKRLKRIYKNLKEGEMIMEPIREAIKNVCTMSNSVSVNKHQCKRIADRFSGVGNGLKGLRFDGGNADERWKDYPFDKLLTVLQKGEALVSSHVGSKRIMSVIKWTTPNREAFNEIHEELDTLKAQFDFESFSEPGQVEDIESSSGDERTDILTRIPGRDSKEILEVMPQIKDSEVVDMEEAVARSGKRLGSDFDMQVFKSG